MRLHAHVKHLRRSMRHNDTLRSLTVDDEAPGGPSAGPKIGLSQIKAHTILRAHCGPEDDSMGPQHGSGRLTEAPKGANTPHGRSQAKSQKLGQALVWRRLWTLRDLEDHLRPKIGLGVHRNRQPSAQLAVPRCTDSRDPAPPQNPIVF